MSQGKILWRVRTEVGTVRQPKGRPLDRSRDVAILAAALEVLAEFGYDRLTMDLVADARAGGQGSSLPPLVFQSRSWSSMLWRSSTRRLPEPDTGTLLGDLDVLLAHRVSRRKRTTSAPVSSPGWPPRAAAIPSLHALFTGRFLETGHRVLRLVLERAVERGEVPKAARSGSHHRDHPCALLLPSTHQRQTAGPGIRPSDRPRGDLPTRGFTAPARGFDQTERLTVSAREMRVDSYPNRYPSPRLRTRGLSW